MLKIEPVRNCKQSEAVYALAYEYIEWLHDSYPEMNKEIDDYLKHQKFDEQIRDVLVHFNPPNGECLLALHGDQPVGILMLKALSDGKCEMNRMFVRNNARGLGAGRALVEHLKQRAIEMGFSQMTLSALRRHHEAIALYRSCGFELDGRELDDREREAGNAENAVLMKIDLKNVRTI